MQQPARNDGIIIGPQPILTSQRVVPADWADYNDHMNEARYLQAFGDATDALLQVVGCDAAYVAAGNSFFTVETHIRHLAEVAVNEPIHTLSQLIAAKGKTLHLFHWLHHTGGPLLATGEHMMVHVSLSSRKACLPLPDVAARLAELQALHADLPLPEGLGRHVGQSVGQKA